MLHQAGRGARITMPRAVTRSTQTVEVIGRGRQQAPRSHLQPGPRVSEVLRPTVRPMARPTQWMQAAPPSPPVRLPFFRSAPAPPQWMERAHSFMREARRSPFAYPADQFIELVGRPTTVRQSGLRPSTSVNLPDELLAVPGAVSRPVSIGDLADDLSQPGATPDYYAYMAEQFAKGAAILRILGPSAGGVLVADGRAGDVLPLPGTVPGAVPRAIAPAPTGPPRPVAPPAPALPTWVWWAGGGVLVLGGVLFVMRRGGAPAPASRRR